MLTLSDLFLPFSLRSHKKCYTNGVRTLQKFPEAERFNSPTHTYVCPTTLHKSMYDDNEHKEDNHSILLSCTAAQQYTMMTTTATSTTMAFMLCVHSKKRKRESKAITQRMENMFTYIVSLHFSFFFGTHANENSFGTEHSTRSARSLAFRKPFDDDDDDDDERIIYQNLQ